MGRSEDSTRSSQFFRPRQKNPNLPRESPPMWRVIGCLLILIVPPVSFMLAKMVVNYGLNHGWPLMPELLGYITLPDWVWKVPTLAHLVAPIAGFNNLKAILVFSLVVLVLLTGLYSTLYAIIYRIFGPPRYSAVDAPPQKRKPKRYIR